MSAKTAVAAAAAPTPTTGPVQFAAARAVEIGRLRWAAALAAEAACDAYGERVLPVQGGAS